MGEVEDLRARIGELERKVEILFSHTGAVDREKVAVDAPPPSSEVEALMAAGKTTKAAKLYQKQTGAGMAETMAALEKLSHPG
jgi:hypothetical protein